MVGKTSLDDCEALTWSLGCTVDAGRRRPAMAITSLAFMFELVPDPVWNTSTGKCSSCVAGGDLVGRRGDRLGDLRFEHADAPVHPRRGRLDQPERADLGALQAAAGDREVLHGALGLRPPQGVGGHPDLAHGVVLDPESVVADHGRSVLRWADRAHVVASVTLTRAIRWSPVRCHVGRAGRVRGGAARYLCSSDVGSGSTDGCPEGERDGVQARDAEREWLELVAEVMAAPLIELPMERIALQLTRTFDAVGLRVQHPARRRAADRGRSTR